MRLLEIAAVAKRFGVSQRLVAKVTSTGQFPAPVAVNPLRWDADEIEAWYAGGCKPVSQPTKELET